MYNFSPFNPKTDLKALADLQNFLIVEIETLLGNRDESKEILPTVFVDGGPYIMNTLDCNGAWIVLSLNSEMYWPCALYELSHEVVHLLNPIKGNTTVIEEAVATYFSEEMIMKYSGVEFKSNKPSYRRAVDLLLKFKGPIYESINSIREDAGALCSVTPDIILKHQPELDAVTVSKLCETFSR